MPRNGRSAKYLFFEKIEAPSDRGFFVAEYGGWSKKKTQGLSWVREGRLSSFDICLCDVSRTDFFLRGEALVFQLENIEDETSQE